MKLGIKSTMCLFSNMPETNWYEETLGNAVVKLLKEAFQMFAVV
jgi:hypothetical protein